MFYGPALARMHRDGYGAHATAGGDLVLHMLQGRGVESGTILDLGCGPGDWLARLAKAGFAPHGVDVSPAFIDLAREAVPTAHLDRDSVYHIEIPSCVAITAFGEVLNYRPAVADGPPPLADLFARVAAALRPGGLFVFDVITRGAPPLTARHWRADTDWAVLSDVVEAPDGIWLRRDIITFKRTEALGAEALGTEAGGWDRADETHLQYLHDVDEARALLEHAGFAVTTTDRYGDRPLLPRRTGFICERR